MKVYTVEQASEITGVPEVEIIDSVRTGELKTYVGSTVEPSFPVPYTGKVVRHRKFIRITEDELEHVSMHLNHRWQYLTYLANESDPEVARSYVQEALLAWYGAALDDPENREAAGVVRCLKVFAAHWGLRQDGTVEDEHAKPLRAVA